jgi:hypothetical protein
MAPGESRPLTIVSDAGPIAVAIECFRRPPTPPELTPCKECGSYSVNSGDTVTITVSSKVSFGARGFLRVVMRDSYDTAEFVLPISGESGAILGG